MRVNRKRSVYRAALPVPYQTSGKVCLCAIMTKAQRAYICMYAWICARTRGGLVNEHKIGGDRSSKRSNGKHSGALRNKIQVNIIDPELSKPVSLITGALQKKCSSEIMYKDIVKASSNDALMTNKQIEKDLLRIMPANACFSHLHSTGIPRLRRVMRALAWLYPDIGYGKIQLY